MGWDGGVLPLEKKALHTKSTTLKDPAVCLHRAERAVGERFTEYSKQQCIYKEQRHSFACFFFDTFPFRSQVGR